MDSPDRRQPHRQMGGWLRQHKNVFLVSGMCLLVLVVVLQFAYPRDRALPFARLSGEAVGYQKSDDILARVQTAFINSKITFHGQSKMTVTKSLSELGAIPNTEQMAQALTTYDWQWRAVPFSLVFLRPTVPHLGVYFSQPQLQAQAGKIAQALSKAPQDAHLGVQGGKLVMTPAIAGYTVIAQDIVTAASSANLAFISTDITPRGKVETAEYTDADLAPARQQAETMIGRHIVLADAEGHHYVPTSADLASWLVIKTQASHGVTLSVDRAAVARYAATINGKLAIPAGTTTVHVQDGLETSRNEGAPGRSVMTAALTDGLMKAMSSHEGEQEIPITYVPAAPKLAYDRQYSSSQEGLRAYVQYVTNTEDVHIALAQLDGNGWTASGRATESIPSASTYKLYIAMILFDKMNRGEIGWLDKVVGDTNVSVCLEQMIVLSLNDCAEQFIANFGRPYIDNYLHTHGISKATTFTAQGAVRTSAADLLATLKGLASGTLYPTANRDVLLEKMGRQIYRQGVPAGSSGSVQDKVGFLWGYLHDAAIIHTKKGTYAVAIMTNNASWQRIAQITAQLERIMYP